MKFQIKIGTAVAIVTYLTAFLYLVSPDLVVSNLSTLRIVGWVIAGALATYFSLGDLHNWIDKKFFHERLKVDTYIKQEIVKPCLRGCSRAAQGIIPAEMGGLTDLFFTFIPADDTERERAFSYFTEYFITVNLTALSGIGFVLAIVLAVFVPSWTTEQYVILSLLLLIFPFIFNYLRMRVRRKLILPTKAQISRIQSRNGNELVSLLPSYRFYEQSTLCKDSQKCPLIPSKDQR
jgi:hypothetical protein